MSISSTSSTPSILTLVGDQGEVRRKNPLLSPLWMRSSLVLTTSITFSKSNPAETKGVDLWGRACLKERVTALQDKKKNYQRLKPPLKEAKHADPYALTDFFLAPIRDPTQCKKVTLLVTEDFNFMSPPTRLANYLKSVTSAKDRKRMVVIPIVCLANDRAHAVV
ncbi:hypothetical protein HAX54_010230 [Datura stramonium]|uniref:Uncharacterized protein n=1 Tax=Datura stramonium TaxID=4076 RepID=A0ABS8RWM7_DATST|nr:hypothetical protein [Datura stramonium]